MCNPFTAVGECIAACLGAAICQGCCTCCSAVGRNTKQFSFIPYMIFVFINGILSLVLRYYGEPLTVHLYITDYTICNNDVCYGIGAVLRVSWALFLFFFIHLLFNVFGGNKYGYKIDTVNWLWKILLYLSMLVVAYLIPDSFYRVYEWIARIVGGIFLVIQMILIIDFAYECNEYLLNKQWLKTILAVSTLIFATSIACCALLFIYFTHQGTSGCTIENFFIGFTLALTVSVTLLSISPLAGTEEDGGGGLLPAAVITANSWWLCYSALESNPSPCVAVPDSSTPLIVISIIIGCVSITYAGYNVATSNSLFGGQSESELHGAASRDLQKELIHDGNNSGDELRHNEINNIPQPPAVYSNTSDIEAQSYQNNNHDNVVHDPAMPGIIPSSQQTDVTAPDSTKLSVRSFRFHFLMCITAMYQAMLFSNWGSLQSATDNISAAYDLSIAAMWIKIVSQWCTILLFTWSLIAPRILTNRSFGVRS